MEANSENGNWKLRRCVDRGPNRGHYTKRCDEPRVNIRVDNENRATLESRRGSRIARGG